MLIAAVVLTVFSMGEPVYAGSLNANEQELMGIIRGTYTYQGVTYRVKAEYIRVAENYLLQDDVDCTDEQKQKAINLMFSSIQQGIDEGYLELAYPQTVSGAPNSENENSGGEEADGKGSFDIMEDSAEENEKNQEENVAPADAQDEFKTGNEAKVTEYGENQKGFQMEARKAMETDSDNWISEPEESQHPLLKALETYAKSSFESTLSGNIPGGQDFSMTESCVETKENILWIGQAESDTGAENTLPGFCHDLIRAAWMVCGGIILGMTALFVFSCRKKLLIIHHMHHTRRRRGIPE